jgi:hypothetical protein
MGFETPHSHEQLSPLTSPDERGESFFGSRAEPAAVLGSPPTTRSAGSAATLQVARLAGVYGALVAPVTMGEGALPTTCSAGSGATLRITRRVRAHRAVAPSM